MGLGASACDLPPESDLRPPADAAVPIDGPPSLPDAGVGPGSDAAGSDAAGAPAGYTIVVLPDTQYYSSSWPAIFAAQTQWIVDNREAQQIAFVLHTGDIVDSDIPEQWDAPIRGLHLLDGLLPYVMSAGNHDYSNLADRIGLINTYFPPSGFAQYPWFGDTYEPGHLENSFSVLHVGTARWLVMSLEFGPRDQVVAWANSVLKVFPDTPTIIITHAYLYRDGTRYDHVGAPGQQFNPHSYVMMGQPGSSVNDGQEMWTKLVEPNSNVRLVMSGHDVSFKNLPPGTAARLTSRRANGTVVHQLLANYQTCTGAPCETFYDGTTLRTVHGGNGFLRLLRVSPAEHSISVTTYSPYLDQYLDDPDNQFVLDTN